MIDDNRAKLWRSLNFREIDLRGLDTDIFKHGAGIILSAMMPIKVEILRERRKSFTDIQDISLV